MAYEFYVSIKGTKQGLFKGESARKGHEDKLTGLGFTYEIISPRDLATGQASGKRQHAPVVFVKEWGAASPQLVQAAETNEIVDVVFEFVKTTADGAGAPFERIHLSNATIANLKRMAGDTVTDRAGPTTLEEITLLYQKLELESLAPPKPGRIATPAPALHPISG